MNILVPFRRYAPQFRFKINLYILFIEKGYYLLSIKNGSLCYITPNNWLTLNTNSDLRKFILTKTYNIKIIQNQSKTFDSASVDTAIIGFNRFGNSIIQYFEWFDTEPILKHTNEAQFYLTKKDYIISDKESTIQLKFGFAKCKIKMLSDIALVKNGVRKFSG